MKYLTGLCVLMLSSSLALAQSSNTHNNTQPTNACPTQQDTSNSNPNHKVQASLLAERVLADTNQARTAIRNKNASQVKACISDALDTMSRIQHMPSANTSTQTSKLVPIYSEFGEVSVLAPVYNQQQQQQQHQMSSAKISAQAKQNNQSSGNSNPQADRSTESSSGNPTTAKTGEASRQQPTVRSVTQSFTSITFDTNMANQHLQAAQSAIQNGNLQKADAELAAVQDSVALVSLETDRPLLRARENLALARGMAEQGHYAKVNAPLRAAANALQDYQAMNPAHAEDARNLSQQISSYASSTVSDRDSALQKIDGWWNTTSDWTANR